MKEGVFSGHKMENENLIRNFCTAYRYEKEPFIIYLNSLGVVAVHFATIPGKRDLV